MMINAQQFKELELIGLLHQCAELLSSAYQETMNKEMWQISEKVRMACDVLKYEFQSSQNLITLH